MPNYCLSVWKDMMYAYFISVLGNLSCEGSFCLMIAMNLFFAHNKYTI